MHLVGFEPGSQKVRTVPELLHVGEFQGELNGLERFCFLLTSVLSLCNLASEVEKVNFGQQEDMR